MDSELPVSEAPVLPDNPFIAPDADIPGDMDSMTEAEVETLIREMQSSMMADTEFGKNPLAGYQVHQLIATFLSAIPQGVRWLADKAQVNRRSLKTFLETGEGIDPIKIPVLIDIIVSRDNADKQRMAEKMARMSVTMTDESSTDKPLPEAVNVEKRAKKKLSNNQAKYRGMSRAERRAEMAKDRRAKKHFVPPPEGEPL